MTSGIERITIDCRSIGHLPTHRPTETARGANLVRSVPICDALSEQAAHQLEQYYTKQLRSNIVEGYNQFLGFPNYNRRYHFLRRRGLLRRQHNL